ncbi:hypothetical protein PSEUDO8O_20353 [Pseudomonas sp. 8O]|nr:hypothetical protein PSEUDO8O_20353 [Pseudomonas sp. 8O]
MHAIICDVSVGLTRLLVSAQKQQCEAFQMDHSHPSGSVGCQPTSCLYAAIVRLLECRHA